MAALCLLALFIRVVPRFDLVFQSGFVNFQENDAWYHVRVAENLVRHFPWRSMVDPYVAFGRVQDTATAPFYDWLLGLIAWLAGAGAPSESLLHVIAAWYPTVLAVFTVVAVFLLAKFVFGLRAALLAAAVIATLPGHFLRVSSLGFTDHHIMESLLVTLFFFLLLRAIERPASLGTALAAGLTLAAYLLTFHGSAFVVGVVVVWALYDRVRSFWPREKPEPALRPLYVAFLVALSVCLVFYRLLWMNYTIAALGLGSLAIGSLELWAKWCRRFARPRLPFFSGLAVTAVAFLAVAAVLTPSLRHSVKSIVARLMPALFGTSGGVYELQSLVYDRGHFTLIPALLQFYGAYFFALLGLFVLAESALKRADPGRALIVFWGLTTFVLAMGQLRMTYYYAIAVALLSGYVADVLLASGRKTAWVTVLCLVLLVFAPNVYAAVNADVSTGVSADWKETLDWMRASTPEPFEDPAFYYARYSRREYGPAYRYPPSAYSVMAWWDYGYWIVDLARRIPVTNPTQANAGVAADFFLAQSEQEAGPIAAGLAHAICGSGSAAPTVAFFGRSSDRRLSGILRVLTGTPAKRLFTGGVAIEPGRPTVAQDVLPSGLLSELGDPVICIRRASRGWAGRRDASVPSAERKSAWWNLPGSSQHQAIRVGARGHGGRSRLPERRLFVSWR